MTGGVHGRDLPAGRVELVRVTDPQPYLEGQRRLEAAWTRHQHQEHSPDASAD